VGRDVQPVAREQLVAYLRQRMNIRVVKGSRVLGTEGARIEAIVHLLEPTPHVM
jgi:hypothetical protein